MNRGENTNQSVAIVTGASQGIGRATAIRLAGDFKSVVLAARNEKALQETAGAVKSAGAEPLALALDLREPGAAKTLVAKHWKNLAKLMRSSTSLARCRKLTFLR